MYNKYTIEVFEIEGQVKATLYEGKNCLGSVWQPVRYTKDKIQYQDLMQSVGNIIYGQESKAQKAEESDSKLLEVLASKSSSGKA